MEKLRTIIKNIIDHPGEDKFRKIKLDNTGFRKYIGQYPSGIQLLQNMGFTKKEGVIKYIKSLAVSVLKNKDIDLNIAEKELK